MNKSENVRAVCSGAAVLNAIKIKVLNTSAKQKNVSDDGNIWKMPDIGQYIGLDDISVDR